MNLSALNTSGSDTVVPAIMRTMQSQSQCIETIERELRNIREEFKGQLQDTILRISAEVTRIMGEVSDVGSSVREETRLRQAEEFKTNAAISSLKNDFEVRGNDWLVHINQSTERVAQELTRRDEENQRKEEELQRIANGKANDIKELQMIQAQTSAEVQRRGEEMKRVATEIQNLAVESSSTRAVCQQISTEMSKQGTTLHQKTDETKDDVAKVSNELAMIRTNLSQFVKEQNKIGQEMGNVRDMLHTTKVAASECSSQIEEHCSLFSLSRSDMSAAVRTGSQTQTLLRTPAFNSILEDVDNRQKQNEKRFEQILETLQSHTIALNGKSEKDALTQTQEILVQTMSTEMQSLRDQMELFHQDLDLRGTQLRDHTQTTVTEYLEGLRGQIDERLNEVGESHNKMMGEVDSLRSHLFALEDRGALKADMQQVSAEVQEVGERCGKGSSDIEMLREQMKNTIHAMALKTELDEAYDDVDKRLRSLYPTRGEVEQHQAETQVQLVEVRTGEKNLADEFANFRASVERTQQAEKEKVEQLLHKQNAINQEVSNFSQRDVATRRDLDELYLERTAAVQTLRQELRTECHSICGEKSNELGRRIQEVFDRALEGAKSIEQTSFRIQKVERDLNAHMKHGVTRIEMDALLQDLRSQFTQTYVANLEKRTPASGMGSNSFASSRAAGDLFPRPTASSTNRSFEQSTLQNLRGNLGQVNGRSSITSPGTERWRGGADRSTLLRSGSGASDTGLAPPPQQHNLHNPSPTTQGGPLPTLPLPGQTPTAHPTDTPNSIPGGATPTNSHTLGSTDQVPPYQLPINSHNQEGGGSQPQPPPPPGGAQPSGFTMQHPPPHPPPPMPPPHNATPSPAPPPPVGLGSVSSTASTPMTGQANGNSPPRTRDVPVPHFSSIAANGPTPTP